MTGSPMTPAYGTPPVASAPRPQAPAQLAAPAIAPVDVPHAAPPAAATGLPRLEQAAPPAVAPLAPATGLPRMEQAAPSGLPRMEQAPPTGLPQMAQAAPSGLPQMAQAAPTGLPQMAQAAPTGLPQIEQAAPTGLPSAQPVPAAPSIGLPQMEPFLPGVSMGVARSEPAKAAPSQVSSASGATEVRARPAALWRRLLSFSVDTAAIAGVAALYITLASSVTGTKAPEAGLTGLDAFVAWLRALHTILVPGFFLVLVLALVYCAVAAFLWNGRTLGRLLLGLRLVDTHGLAPAPGRAILRALLASVSFVFFLGGFWMALFDRRGQTLHDKLTSTFVVQPS